MLDGHAIATRKVLGEPINFVLLVRTNQIWSSDLKSQFRLLLFLRYFFSNYNLDIAVHYEDNTFVGLNCKRLVDSMT